MASDLVARQGDVLVVTYPEIKIPVVKFGTVGVGGLTYSRQMEAGENIGEQYERVYQFLKTAAEKDAREKVQLWRNELEPRPAVVAPKPAGVAPRPAGAPPPINRPTSGGRS